MNLYFHPAVPIYPEHVVATPGASSCLDSLFFSICDEGDCVLVPTPYWSKSQRFFPLYFFFFLFFFSFFLFFSLSICMSSISAAPDRKALAFFAHIQQMVSTFTSGFELGSSSFPSQHPTSPKTATSALLPALRKSYDSAPEPARIKAVLLTNPNNPLGVCYPASVIRECIRFCQQRGLHFVSDEVYALSAHEGVKEEMSESFVSALALLGDNENENSTVNEKETTKNATIDKEVNQGLVHVIWSMSKDLGSSGISIVRSAP